MKIAFALAAACLLTMTAVDAARMRDGAVIQNSGSTNTRGYTIKVWADGSTLAGGVRGHVAADLVRKFFADARAGKAEGRVARSGCIKSASFGTSTFVLYHGWTSGDLQCPGGGGLASEAAAIAAALHLPEVLRPRRIPMLPGETRRTEPTPTPSPGQAAPSPEFARPAP